MSTTITVTSAAELNQALSQASGGETILLAAGDYGRVNIKTQYASNVTIKSADSNAPAEISELRVTGASNVTFEDVIFDYTFSGQAKSYSPFQIRSSSNITIKDSIFAGDVASGVSAVDNGYGTGNGLYVRGSSDVVVENNEFFDWRVGVHVSASSDVAVSGNNIHSIRADGMYLDGNQGILVEGNYLHDFERSFQSGDHADFIQVSKTHSPSSDVTIRGNIIDMGAGDYAQAIFMGNAGTNPNDPALFYKNVLIEDNVIFNAHTHGISVGSAQDVTISNNTVLAVPGQLTGGVSIPAIRVGGASQNVTIDQNVTSEVIGYNSQPSWNVTSNVYVQNTNPNAPNYYNDVFTIYATGAQDGYNQFGVQPGSVIDTTGAGSDLVQQFPMSYDSWVGTGTTGSTGSNAGTTTPDTGTTTPDTGTTTPDTGTTTPDTGTTVPDTDTNSRDTGTTTPDTGTTTPDTGTTTPDTGTTTPDTGTTTPDTGTTTPDTGTTTPDTGTTTPDTGTTTPDAGQGFGMVFDDYVLDIANLPGSGQAALKGDATVTNSASGPAIQLDGQDDFVKLGRLKEFESSEQIAFTVEFTRDEADGSAQRLVWNHTNIGLTLTGDGLIAHVANEDAKFNKGFKAFDLGLNDTDTHEISLLVDQNADRLQVIVDDEVVIDESGVDFDFVGGREYGWTLGTPWGRDVDGEISAFAIDDEVQFVDTSPLYDGLIA